MAVSKHIFGSREEWLEGRKNHIGGSDASACLGLNHYKDNIHLWEEKVGLIMPEDISGKKYVRYGTEAEKHLRSLFALHCPRYQVTYDENNMFTNDRYPWMHASLDGELVDEQGRHGILEIKTSSLMQGMQWEKWRGRIPDNYYCQVLHYLAVTEYDFAVLEAELRSERNGEPEFLIKHYFIEREDVEEDIRQLILAEKKLWNCVREGRRPDRILPMI